MGFSVFVEMLNQSLRKYEKQPLQLHQPYAVESEENA